MRKHPIFTCLFLSFALLCGGISLAYYNTRTFGFDENASVITVYPKSVKVLDYNIEYAKIKKIYKKAKEYVPDEWIAVSYKEIQGMVYHSKECRHIMYI